MTKNLDKIIKICKDYQKILDDVPFSYGNYPNLIIEACEKLKVLGYEWGEEITYPDFSVVKKPYITNSNTKYQFEDDKYYIVWDNGNIGRLQFVRQDYWWNVGDEWQEFIDKLMLYDPVDYDTLNCRMIFDIENGKRLLNDYPAITAETRKKMGQKIKVLKLEKAKKEYEKLLEEMENEA